MCSLFMNSTAIHHQWCYFTTSGIENPSSDHARGVHHVGSWLDPGWWDSHRAGEPGSRKEGFPGDKTAPWKMSRAGGGGLKDSGSQARVLHMKWPGYQRQRGTWKICHSQEEARKPQRSSGTWWCKNHNRSSDVGTGILLTGCCGAPKCSFEKRDEARESIFQSFNHEHRGRNELWVVFKS